MLSQQTDAFLTFLAALVIFARSKRVFHARVANDRHCFLRFNWYLRSFKRAAIEEHRVSGTAKHGGKLVHDPRASANVLVLGILGRKSEFFAIHLDARQL